MEGKELTFPGTDSHWYYLRPSTKVQGKRTDLLKLGDGWVNDKDVTDTVGIVTKRDENVRRKKVSNMTYQDLVQEKYEDEFLITQSQTMRCFTDLTQYNAKDLPHCLKDIYFRLTPGESTRRYYVIKSCMTSIRDKSHPFAASIKDVDSFIMENEQWIAAPWVLGLYPKELVISVQPNGKEVKIGANVMREMKSMWKKHNDGRVAKCQFYSGYPFQYRCQLERSSRKTEWIYLTPDEFPLRDILSEEQHNHMLFTNPIVQGTYATLTFGAGCKSGVVASKDGEEHIDSPKETPDIITKPIFWVVSGDMNQCAKAAVVNLVAALGDRGNAEWLKRVSQQSPHDAAVTLGVGLPKSGSGSWNPIDYAIWMLISLCGGEHVTLMENKPWTASDIIRKIGGLAYPVIVELVSKGSSRSHVIVVLSQQIYCCESETSYSFCIENLNYSCGPGQIFDRAKRIIGIVPNQDLRDKFNATRKLDGLSPITWDPQELMSFVQKKKKRRKRKRRKEDS